MDILNNEFLLFIKCAQQNNLNYLLIGGFAVNYHGYARNTKDMDVWLKPTNENKKAFIDTLLCMKYSENEVALLYAEDFSKSFVGTIGSADSEIDILTVVHHDILYEEAEKEKDVLEVEKDLFMNFVPYKVLKEMKLRAHRDKDLFDIARLEEIRNKK
jgi:hypothetical protein